MMLRSALIAVLLTSATSALVKGLGADVSVGQIRETLQNILQSLQDDAHEFDDAYEQRQAFCVPALKSLKSENEEAGRASQHLQSDLEEQRATVDEISGMAQQVDADVALMQRTINATQTLIQQEVAKAKASQLDALADNKLKTLSSLKGELEVLHPALSTARAQAAETEQRLGDRKNGKTVGEAFLMAMHNGCLESQKRAKNRVEVRLHASTSVQSAMRNLALIAQSVQPESDDAAGAETATDAGVSLVQTGRDVDLTSDDELLSIFDGPPSVSSAPTVTAPRRQTVSAVAAANGASRSKDIKNLIGTLEDEKVSNNQSAWCVHENARNKLSMKQAQDSLAQVKSDIESHTSAKTELEDESARVRNGTAAVRDALTKFSTIAKREESLLSTNVRDQKLAVKILAQASAILGDLKSRNLLNEKAVTFASDAANELTSAKDVIETQNDDVDAQRHEATTAMELVVQASSGVLHSNSREAVHLGRDLDLHITLLEQALKTKLEKEAQVSSAKDYDHKLVEECALVADNQEQTSDRKVEIHALKDAENMLDGKEVNEQAATLLRGGVSAPRVTNNGRALTPMEKAAAAMGIPLDEPSI